MESNIFNQRKKQLVDFVSGFKNDNSLSLVDIKSLDKLMEILESYSFENRKEKKGVLTRTIIDSLEMDYFLGEKFIQFDNCIS